MRVDLDRDDLICLIKGTGGPNKYTDIFSRAGEIKGYPNEKWFWNNEYLSTIPESLLYDLYIDLKRFNQM